MSYEWIASPNFKAGRTSALKYIVIHWWDDPAKKPKIEGVINHFKKASVQVAAHYIVSGDRIVQMVKESDTAWHARSANPYTIGIEVDPQTPGNTYATVARLVREIRQRHGNLPIKPHKDFVQTSCPGTLDLARIDREANATNTPSGGNAMDGKFKNDDEIQEAYFALRGKRATAEEVAGHRNSTWRQFFTNQYAITEIKNRTAETDQLRGQVNSLMSELKTAKDQLQDRAPIADPALAEKVRKYDLIKEGLK